MMKTNDNQLIHLLYVPTIYCNLGCQYCYLGSQTDSKERKQDWDRALSTLQFAVEKFHQQDIVPFNVSLHGGEVTTLPATVLESLFQYINQYYLEQKEYLHQQGFNKNNPHVKTNLFNFDKHYDLFVDNHVSISASIDLPLSLHEKYRTTKNGGSTLQRTLQNLSLLANYPHKYKISAVLYEEHLAQTDDIIHDIETMHNNYGINMNHFNFMFGFESSKNNEKFHDKTTLKTQAARDAEQVQFYNRLKEKFCGTALDEGFNKHWFEEFTPSYCTNAFNCGEKFFLLQSDGNIYSCVRGQGVEPFHYGNIFSDEVSQILDNAERKINSAHRTVGMHDDCKKCEYLSLCQTGCPYVKLEQDKSKSYTCSLQKEIYRNYPALYPPTPVAEQEKALNSYIVDMHPQLISTALKPATKPALILPNDLYEDKNALTELITQDDKLKQLYSPDAIFIEVNQQRFALQSQILKPERKIISLGQQDDVSLHIRKDLFTVNCDEPIRNKLMLQFLRDSTVVYGDEQRSKQEHTYNHEIYKNLLPDSPTLGKDYYCYSLVKLLDLISPSYIEGTINNLFITTSYLRQYHYEKQKNNAFYHIQAINLPFQNLEFYWRNTRS